MGEGGSSRAFAIYFPVPLLDCCNKRVAFTVQIMLIKPYLDLYSELPYWSKKVSAFSRSEHVQACLPSHQKLGELCSPPLQNIECFLNQCLFTSSRASSQLDMSSSSELRDDNCDEGIFGTKIQFLGNSRASKQDLPEPKVAPGKWRYAVPAMSYDQTD